MITLVILVSIIALLLIAGLLISKETIIEKTIIINKPVSEVFNYVRFTKNHDEFSVWNMADPGMKKDYRGTDGTVGFVYSWDSQQKNVGAGEQETKGIVDNASIEYELRFKRPMQDVAVAKYKFNSKNAGQTEVLWGFYGQTKFPMNLMKPLLINMLGKAMTTTLTNLKSKSEAN